MNLNTYFRSYQNHFWEYAESGLVIAIPGGPTITYFDFAIKMLEKLANQPVPPFPVLLMCLAATQPHHDAALKALLEKLRNQKDVDRKLIDEASIFLTRLSRLPEQYKTGPKKVKLLRCIFSELHNAVAPRRIKVILEQLRQNKTNLSFFFSPKPASPWVPTVYLRVFSLLNKKFPSVHSILEQMANIPDFEEEIIPLPATQSSEEQPDQTLVEELLGNPKTYKPAALIRRIWSGFPIPFHNVLPTQQAIGGFADLTNKGEFDKLLVSEFAHDDTVLLSRLANNEALYIQRESPPADEELERVLLIDVTLKSWGTPKLVALATAIAMSEHPKSDINCLSFAVGKECTPMPLDTLDQVIESKQQLDCNLSPVEGIAAFLQKQKEDKTKTEKEIFLITTAETLRNPAMTQLLNEYRSAISYFILTGKNGEMDLYRNRNNSRQHLQSIQLPLKKLWESPPKKRKQELYKQKDKLIVDYPILFPNCSNIKRILFTNKEGFLFVITNEKRIMKSSVKDRNRGWEMVNLNIGTLAGQFEVGKMDNEEVFFLNHQLHPKTTTLHNLTTGEKKSLGVSSFRPNNLYPLFFFKNEFYMIEARKSGWIINPYNDSLISYHDQIKKGVFDALEKRKEESKKMKHALINNNNSLLKNIKEVFVNGKNELVFNKHALRLNTHGVLKLEVTPDLTRNISSVAEGTSFIFPDGSQISNDRTGILVFKSSDKDIPTIYLPTILDSALAAATEDSFCGNTYYKPRNKGFNLPHMDTLKFWQEYFHPFINSLGTKR